MSDMSDVVRRRIEEALDEDVGAGDWTTRWCVEPDTEARAEIVAGAPGVLAGLAPATEVYRILGGAELRPLAGPGDRVEAGETVARVEGAAHSILTGERVCLNFLMHLSGVATLARRFVDAVAGTGVAITDTRKTTPLWRELERAATRAGGAVNHRSGLFDMVLIKENHIVCAGGIGAAVRRARQANEVGLKVEVEARDLDEVREALSVGADRIMLDNMSVDRVADAASLSQEHRPRPELEASGGITLETVGDFAATGVDYISIGALTHSAPALDLSLRITRAGL